MYNCYTSNKNLFWFCFSFGVRSTLTFDMCFVQIVIRKLLQNYKLTFTEWQLQNNKQEIQDIQEIFFYI